VLGLVTASYVWIARPSAVFEELAQPTETASSDYELFDIVLLDLIDNNDFNPATGGRAVSKPHIVFGDLTVGGVSDGVFTSTLHDIAKNIPDDVKNDLVCVAKLIDMKSAIPDQLR
jgi:hypothetical protein